MTVSKLCPCGSGEPRRELSDAAGFFCTFVCDQCEAHRRDEFDPRIFDRDSRYAVTGDEMDIE